MPDERQRQRKSEHDVAHAKVLDVEMYDTREMTYKELGERYNLSAEKVKRMEATGFWSSLIIEVYLKRYMDNVNGEPGSEKDTYDNLRAELVKNMADIDDIHVGSKDYIQVMNVWTQVFQNATRMDKVDTDTFANVDLQKGVNRVRKERKRRKD